MIRLALPMKEGCFSEHFGRCDGVYLCELDEATGQIDRPRAIRRDHAGCEHMPVWLSTLGVNVVVAGGIGAGAQQRLAQLNIRVAAGYAGTDPAEVIRQYIEQPAGGSANTCAGHDHEHHHCHD